MVATVSAIAPYVDATGIHVSDFPTALAYFENQYRGIYGADVYLEPDSQDGQFIGILALAYTDCASGLVATFNSFSPATAQGAGLSSVVKINGIAREIASYSSVDVTIAGTVGTTITNGSIRDQNGLIWSLPASVVIPGAGTVVVTATCAIIGAIACSPDTPWTINTPTSGWTGVTNTGSGTPGNPVETDAELRVRQAGSTMLPSLTVADGIKGALLALPGVTRVSVDENDTSATDADGTAANGTTWVVEGGDATAIATVIANKKTMGSPTAGTTTETVIDSGGLSRIISFDRPTETTIIVTLTLKALPGYTNAIGATAAAQVATYIAGLPIGGTIYISRLYVPATLAPTLGGSTYNITSIQIARSGSAVSSVDLPLAFNEAAVCAPTNVTVSAS